MGGGGGRGAGGGVEGVGEEVGGQTPLSVTLRQGG